jgi:hypothetical protein
MMSDEPFYACSQPSHPRRGEYLGTVCQHTPGHGHLEGARRVVRVFDLLFRYAGRATAT